MLSFYAEMIANINIIQLFQDYQRFIDTDSLLFDSVSDQCFVLGRLGYVANIQSFAWNKESLESWQMVEPWNSFLGSNFQTQKMHLE